MDHNNWLYYSAQIGDLPSLECSTLDLEIHAFFSGPDVGAALFDHLETATPRAEDGTPASKTSSKEPSVFKSQEIKAPRDGMLRSKIKTATELTKRNKQKQKRDSKNSDTNPNSDAVQRWKTRNRKAYGISVSLYDVHPVSGKVTGDPIADCFAVVAMRNCSLLVLADGVNWGERSKIAARAAVFGCVRFIMSKLGAESLFNDGVSTKADATATAAAPANENANRVVFKSTRQVFELLIQTVHVAHQTVLEHQGGATTLCLALVVPLASASEYAVCCINVGDSPAFLLSKRRGLHEVTVGSHDIERNRDLKDTGGAIGAVYSDGEPELHNLTASLALARPGDVLFLTSDGVSDNFDPVVRRVAVVNAEAAVDVSQQQPFTLTQSLMDSLRHIDDEMSEDENLITECVTLMHSSFNTPQTANSNDSGYEDAPPTILRSASNPGTGGASSVLYVTARERYLMTVKEIERVIHQFEADSQSRPGAHELCALLIQHAVACTQPKRFVLERSRIELAQRRKQLEVEHGLVDDTSADELQNDAADASSPRRWKIRSPKLLRRLPFTLRKDSQSQSQTPQRQQPGAADEPVAAGRTRNGNSLSETEKSARKLKKAEVAKLLKREKEVIESRLAELLRGVPGKFDHASICAVEIGAFRDDENEDYELQLQS